MGLDYLRLDMNSVDSLTSIVSSQREEYIPTPSTNLTAQDHQEDLRRYVAFMSTFQSLQSNDGLAAASSIAMESPRLDHNANRSLLPQPEIETESEGAKETAVEPLAETTATSKDLQPHKCPVCLNFVHNREPATTTCGHVFCSKCIKTALSATCKCPVCQKLMTLRQVIRIYI